MTLPPFRPAAGTGNPPAPSAPLRRDERDAVEALNAMHAARIAELLPPTSASYPTTSAAEPVSAAEFLAAREREPRRPSLAERLAVTRAAGRRP